MKNIVLTGFMGTGKTTVGRRLADELGFRFLDTDEIIEAEAGMPVSRIFAEKGERSFRSLEGELVSRLTENAFGENIVLSTGGGLIVDKKNRDALRRWGMLVCLKASVDSILARVKGREDRPLLSGPDKRNKIAGLLSSREDAYADCGVVIDTTSLSVAEVCARIKSLFRDGA